MDPFADFRAFWQLQCRVTGGRVSQGPVQRMESPVPAMPVNGVLRSTGPAHAVDAELQHHMDRGKPFTWYVFPGDDPDLLDTLEESGMERLPGFTAVQRSAWTAEPDDEVHWISAERVDEWIDVVMAAFDIPRRHTDGARAMQRGLLDSGKVRCLAIEEDTRPIATLSLFSGTGQAGLYQGAVRPDARRGGLASRLMETAVAQAASEGLTDVVGATTEDGLGLCRGLGFEEAGRIEQFVWRPSA